MSNLDLALLMMSNARGDHKWDSLESLVGDMIARTQDNPWENNSDPGRWMTISLDNKIVGANVIVTPKVTYFSMCMNMSARPGRVISARGIEYVTGQWLVVKYAKHKGYGDSQSQLFLVDEIGQTSTPITAEDAIARMHISRFMAVTARGPWQDRATDDLRIMKRYLRPNAFQTRMSVHITFYPGDFPMSSPIIVRELVLLVAQGLAQYRDQTSIPLQTCNISDRVAALVQLYLGDINEKMLGDVTDWVEFTKIRNALTPDEFVKYHQVLNEILHLPRVRIASHF